jgi:hypothetical protein
MAKRPFSLWSVYHTPGKSDLPTHTPGTGKGEEWVRRYGREPGRTAEGTDRIARDSTSINAHLRDPIDPRMPHLPPP